MHAIIQMCFFEAIYFSPLRKRSAITENKHKKSGQPDLNPEMYFCLLIWWVYSVWCNVIRNEMFVKMVTDKSQMFVNAKKQNRSTSSCPRLMAYLLQTAIWQASANCEVGGDVEFIALWRYFSICGNDLGSLLLLLPRPS
jgi:hypothetical protein